MPERYDYENMPYFLSREGRILPGTRRDVVIPTPPAGTNINTYKVPAGVQWRMLQTVCRFTADTTVASSLIGHFRDPDNTDHYLFGTNGTIAMTAGTQYFFGFELGSGDAVYFNESQATENIYSIGLPNAWLDPGYFLFASILGQGVTSQWVGQGSGGWRVTVEEVFVTNDQMRNWVQAERRRHILDMIDAGLTASQVERTMTTALQA
jgi:hypothetical protein